MSRSERATVPDLATLIVMRPGVQINGKDLPVGSRQDGSAWATLPALLKLDMVRLLDPGTAAEESEKQRARDEMALGPLEQELAETTAALPVAAKRQAVAEAAKASNDAALADRDRIRLEERGSRNAHQALQVRLDELRIEVSSLRARLARGVAA